LFERNHSSTENATSLAPPDAAGRCTKSSVPSKDSAPMLPNAASGASPSFVLPSVFASGAASPLPAPAVAPPPSWPPPPARPGRAARGRPRGRAGSHHPRRRRRKTHRAPVREPRSRIPKLGGNPCTNDTRGRGSDSGTIHRSDFDLHAELDHPPRRELEERR